jgi:hypothetical protein
MKIVIIVLIVTIILYIIFLRLAKNADRKANQSASFKDNILTFTLYYVDDDSLSKCKVGHYVSLWTKPDMDKVIIYAPGSVGGSGRLGIVPYKYYRTIQKHILKAKNYGISGPSTHNYDATVINIAESNCTIEIKLHSAKKHKKRIMEIVKQ